MGITANGAAANILPTPDIPRTDPSIASFKIATPKPAASEKPMQEKQWQFD